MKEQPTDMDRLASRLQQADRRIEELRHRHYVMVCLIVVLIVWAVYLLIDRREHIAKARQWSTELALLSDKTSDVSSTMDDLQGEFEDLDNNSADWKELGREVEKISGEIGRDVNDLDEKIGKLGDRISDSAAGNDSDE